MFWAAGAVLLAVAVAITGWVLIMYVWTKRSERRERAFVKNSSISNGPTFTLFLPGHGICDRSCEDFHCEYVHRSEPTIKYVHNLCSVEECRDIIYRYRKRMKRSNVFKNGSRKDVQRTSYTAFTDGEKDLQLKAIMARIAKLINRPIEWLEKPQLTRYKKGNYYKAHYDTLVPRVDNGNYGSQREYTVVLYLNDLPEDEEGGSTSFHTVHKRVRPVCGNALIWRNCLDNGDTDKRTLHSGDPIVRRHSTKYILTVWSRMGPCEHGS